MTNTPSPSVSKDDVYAWICDNPDMDAADVAEQFGIGLIEAILITASLLEEGRIATCDPTSVKLFASRQETQTRKE